MAEIANLDEIKNILRAKGRFEGKIFFKKSCVEWMLKMAKDSERGENLEGKCKSLNRAQLILNNLNSVPEEKENNVPPTLLPI